MSNGANVQAKLRPRVMMITCNGDTPVHYAASYNNVDILWLLIKQCGASPNVRDDVCVHARNVYDRQSNRTPLHSAVCNGHIEAISTLIDLGCDVNAVDNVRDSDVYCMTM